MAEHALCRFCSMPISRFSDIGWVHKLPTECVSALPQRRSRRHAECRPWSDTDRELVADVLDAELGLRTDVHLEVGAAVLDAVAPLIAARVRAEEREALAQHFTNLANLAASEGRRTHSKEMRHAAAIARAHRTTPGDDHA